MRQTSTISVRRRRTVSSSSSSSSAMPETLSPMLATLGEMPREPDEFSFEYKWDGVRALCFLDERNGSLRLLSRNQLDITMRYPELSALSDALAGHRVILDGEIVALDDAGRPSFARLQRRMHVANPGVVRSLMRTVPIWYVLFDLLYLDRRSTMNLPYEQRRELLENLTLAGPFWQVTPAHVGEGEPMLEAARANHLEGLVAKRLDSIYEPGRRSPAWRKIKITHRQEFVVGGWVEQNGDPSRVGSLLIGYYDCDGKLRFAGGVGSGFTDAEHARLVGLLRRHEVSRSSFAERIPHQRIARFVMPTLVIEVEYRRWPEDGLVQQGTYQGLRSDKKAREVVRELPQLSELS
jgi:bifunctional non-homologous end joining protein LigD